jgi:hypothetical protein
MEHAAAECPVIIISNDVRKIVYIYQMYAHAFFFPDPYCSNPYGRVSEFMYN